MFIFHCLLRNALVICYDPICNANKKHSRCNIFTYIFTKELYVKLPWWDWSQILCNFSPVLLDYKSGIFCSVCSVFSKCSLSFSSRPLIFCNYLWNPLNTFSYVKAQCKREIFCLLDFLLDGRTHNMPEA